MLWDVIDVVLTQGYLHKGNYILQSSKPLCPRRALQIWDGGGDEKGESPVVNFCTLRPFQKVLSLLEEDCWHTQSVMGGVSVVNKRKMP